MRAVLVACAGLLAAAGCTKKQRSPLYGRVTVAGQPASAGEVRFVPIDEGGPGPARGNTEVMIQPDGSYKCATLGGIPVGRYRVEVDARKKTGRKVQKRDEGTGEMVEVEESAPAGPKSYNGPGSPLTLDTAVTQGEFNIDLPAN